MDDFGVAIFEEIHHIFPMNMAKELEGWPHCQVMMELPDYNFYEFKEPLDAFRSEEWEDRLYKNRPGLPWEPPDWV